MKSAATVDPATGVATDVVDNESPQFTDDAPLLASDVPAWWHIQKKGGIYYTGQGQGDFTRLLTQISIVGIQDATHAADIAEDFDDVLAWMMTLQPPPWPGSFMRRANMTG